jgi:drug/metabolite transporter (DMT)-like permease
LVALLSSALLFAAMGAFTKAAMRVPGLPGGAVACFRYSFGLAVLLALHRTMGADLLGTDRKGLLWRGLFGGFASVLFFLGIEYTSLTNATLLNYTSIIWAPLVAVFTLHERIGRRGALAILVAVVGVLLVTRPEAGQSLRLGDAIALLSGVLAGGAIVQIRRLRQGESSFAVFFYFNLLGLPVSLLALLLGNKPLVFPQMLAPYLLLVGMGITSVAAQLLMTYGYREMTAAEGSLLTLTSVMFSALLAWFIFGEPLSATTVVGGLLILFGAAALVTKAVPEQQRSRPAPVEKR